MWQAIQAGLAIVGALCLGCSGGLVLLVLILDWRRNRRERRRQAEMNLENERLLGSIPARYIKSLDREVGPW